MNIQDIKLWVEYKKHIEDKNTPMLKVWREMQDKEMARYNREYEAYKIAQAKYEKRLEKREKEREEWDNLPFYKKWFTPEPEFIWWFEGPRWPMMPHTWMPFLYPVTQEGFMDYVASKRKLLPLN